MKTAALMIDSGAQKSEHTKENASVFHIYIYILNTQTRTQTRTQTQTRTRTRTHTHTHTHARTHARMHARTHAHTHTHTHTLCRYIQCVYIYIYINNLPSSHPRCRWVSFFMRTDLEKLIYQWILCSEWVPSEWESKQLIKTSQYVCIFR